MPEEVREKFLGKKTETAPVIDTLALVRWFDYCADIEGLYQSSWKGTSTSYPYYCEGSICVTQSGDED
jgi:hypothetical protein